MRATHNADCDARIVNRSGRWQAQRRSEEKGTKTFDPWYDVGHAKDTPAAAAAVVGIKI